MDLKQWLTHRHQQAINQEQAVDWLRQLTQILQQLHQQAFFHRDIKPSNIILKPDGKLVLIDFGSVGQSTETDLQQWQNSQTGTRLHSMGYAPLEQIDGKAVPQSDFFALGRTFVHLLTGNPPYEFSCDPSTGQLKWRGDAPHISESLADLIDWLMAPFPGQRPQNPQAILRVLTAMRQEKLLRRVEFSLVGLWSGVATGILIGMRLLGSLQAMELKAFDQMMQWRPLEKADDRLVLIEVTPEDINGLGNKLLKRDQTILQLLQKLDEHQPKAIGLDLYQEVAGEERQPALIQYLQQSQHIIPICAHPDDSQDTSGGAPLPNISKNQLGFVDIVLDPDNIVRRHLLGVKPEDDSPCPASYALSTQLALLYLEAQGYTLTFPTTETWQLNKRGTKPIHFHVLQRYRGFYPQFEMFPGHQILLNYRRLKLLDGIVPEGNRFSVTDILNDQLSPDRIKDKIVFIGTDPTINDNFNTPYKDMNIRGVTLHTTMVSQLISAVEGGRPLLHFWPLWADILWILSWSGVGVILPWRIQTDKSTRTISLLYWGLASGIMLLNLSAVCFLLLLSKGVVLPFVPSALTFVVAGSGVIVYNRLQVKKKYFPNHFNWARILLEGSTE